MPLDLSDLLGKLPVEPITREPIIRQMMPMAIQQQLASMGLNGNNSLAGLTAAQPTSGYNFSRSALSGLSGASAGASGAAPSLVGQIASTTPSWAGPTGKAASTLTPEAAAWMGLNGLTKSGGRILPYGALKGLGIAGAGVAASQAAGKYLDNEGTYWDEGLSGALAAAGMGGAVAGPWGALAAAPVGLALGLWGPKNTGTHAVAAETENQQGKLDAILKQYPISQQNQQQIQLQLQLGLQDANSKDQVKAAYQGIMQQLPGLIMQDQAQTQDTARAAAIYAMLTPALERSNHQASQTAARLSQAMQSGASGISDPGLRAVYEARAQEIPAQTSRANSNQLLQLALADAAYQSQAKQAIAAHQQSQLSPQLAQQLGG